MDGQGMGQQGQQQFMCKLAPRPKRPPRWLHSDEMEAGMKHRAAHRAYLSCLQSQLHPLRVCYLLSSSLTSSSPLSCPPCEVCAASADGPGRADDGSDAGPRWGRPWRWADDGADADADANAEPAAGWAARDAAVRDGQEKMDSPSKLLLRIRLRSSDSEQLRRLCRAVPFKFLSRRVGLPR